MCGYSKARSPRRKFSENFDEKKNTFGIFTESDHFHRITPLKIDGDYSVKMI